MPLGQGWLNAWVKVNNKHVVYNRPEGEQGQFSTAPTKPFKSSRTISSAKTTRTLISDDAESQSIRRVNSRKNRRRLHRTISASDLIRDQARSLAGKAEGGVSLDVSAQSQISAEHTRDSSSLGGLPPLVNNHEQCGDRSAARMETEQSLLFVSGLFGADIDSFARREPPKLGDHFMDKDGVLLQWAPQTQILDSASIQSRGVISLPVHHATPQAHRAEPDDNVSKGGFRFPPNIFSSDNGKSRCGQCTNYENELSALQDDLEYVRSVALRNEYVCTTCNAESSKHPTEVPSALHLTNSTRLLDEVTARHKTQLEQLTKDRQRWQHDAHVKLQKYAALCKDLNEEATMRNEEVISLHKEVDSLRIERDQMAGDLEIARAVIANNKRDAVERRKLEEKLLQYESRGLDEAENAIKTRDAIIADLSARLEKTLDVLEIEREQQRQRRQIIFPTQRVSLSSDQEDLASELRNTKARLAQTQAELHSLQRLNENKDASLTSQAEALQRQFHYAV